MPEYIKKDPELMKLINEIKDADIEDGGSGAFYIFLKKKEAPIIIINFFIFFLERFIV